MVMYYALTSRLCSETSCCKTSFTQKEVTSHSVPLAQTSKRTQICSDSNMQVITAMETVVFATTPDEGTMPHAFQVSVQSISLK